MHDRVIVDNISEFEHSSSRSSCTFSMQDSRVKRGSNTGHKTQQARLPADSGLYNSTSPSLVNCILNIPECQSDHHGSCASTAWSQQSVCSLYRPRARQSPTWRQSVHKNSYCLLLLLCSCFALALLLLCSCFAHCSWFHSVCANVSMFTITGTCLFLFLFLFLFLGRHQNTTKAFVLTSRPLHLHRSKPLRVHTKSVCVRTRSAYLLRAVHIQSLQTLRQIHQWLVTII